MLFQLSHNISSRAATMENPTGQPGRGGMAGNGRKSRPALCPFTAGMTHTLLDTDGPGMVRHIWLTVPPAPPAIMRNLILRMYWDNASHPSVEVPLTDFFGLAHGRALPLTTAHFGIQSGRGFNCWYPMPFARHARITLENDSGQDVNLLFYQVDYSVGDPVDEDTGYFHAQFRRQNPCPMGQDYTICEITGRGQYIGTVIGVRSLYQGDWWGEGEIKAYIDGDDPYPTICGTGTEDYIGSAWGLSPVQTPYQGAPLVDDENGYYSLYRLHTLDPIRFETGLKLTLQQIGCGNTPTVRQHYGQDFVCHPACGGKPEEQLCYFERSDDYCSVAFWYQQGVHPPFPTLPDRQQRSRDLPAENTVARQDQ